MNEEKIFDNVEHYLSGLHSTIHGIKTVQSLYDPIVAFGFNLFNFWRTTENKTSEILAFFLDPAQTHGQGDAFLKVFIEELNFDSFNYDTKNVKVKCEYGISNQRRIDILLSFHNDDFGIAIENKLEASDQQNQLDDYSDFLNKKLKNISFYI